MTVEARMNDVTTQLMCSTPCSSPTIVGMALESTVLLREAMSIVTMSPRKRGTILRLWAPAASATAAGLTAPASGVVVASAVVAASVRACESMLGESS